MLTAAPLPAKSAAWRARWTAGRLRPQFWVFFSAAFFFDLGFAIYFFLFPLYLLDQHYDERTIGFVGGALTLGSVLGTLPAGMLARRMGLKPLLVACFVGAPLAGVARALCSGQMAHVGLALAAGVAMCLWGVCFSPTIARLTSESERAFAFSLIFSVGIGTSALGGVLSGYLPRWLERYGLHFAPAAFKRSLLLSACLFAALGLVAILRLDLPHLREPAPRSTVSGGLRRRWNPFLVRFLPAMALWSAVTASFTPFASAFFSRQMQLPLTRVGIIFSLSQLLQLCAGLLAPLLFQSMGLLRGIVLTQVVTAAAFGLLAGAHHAGSTQVIYLLLSATQWMSSPGLYSFLMNRVPDHQQSLASSLTIFCNSVVQAGVTALTGICITSFGYGRVLWAWMAAAMLAAALFRFVVARSAAEVEGSAGMAALPGARGS